MESDSHILAVVLLLLCFTTSQNTVKSATYSAGVVEFAADSLQPLESPPELILRNAKRYVEIISTAAEHGVDILVFPECGLTSITVPVVRELIPPYLTEIPAVGTNPCELPDAPKVLKILSCAARSSKIYTVFNLEELARCPIGQTGCTSDGFLFYNTNLALDRNGTIVARYRKFNLFIEPEFNITKVPDYSWFDTDFGVKFGIFICFDILFKEPTVGLLSQLNISNFVYSTAWFSELPFLSATQVQAGWAYSNDVNLLAAGYSNTTNKNAGSGIYAGRDGALIATMPQQSSTTLLIAHISPEQRGIKPLPTEEIKFSEDHIKELNFFHDDITSYKNLQISSKTSHLDYENEGFICNITATISTIGDGSVYRLVAYSGIRSYALVRTVRIEVCGIIACMDSTLSSCGYRPSFRSSTVFNNISISAFSDNQLLSYPITMNSDLLPVSSNTFNYVFEDKNNINMFTKTSHSNLMAFALFRNG